MMPALGLADLGFDRPILETPFWLAGMLLFFLSFPLFLLADRFGDRVKLTVK